MLIFSTIEKKIPQISLILEILLNFKGYYCIRRKGKLEVKGVFTPIMFPCVPKLRSTAGRLVLPWKTHLSKSCFSQKPSPIIFVLPTHFMWNLAHLLPFMKSKSKSCPSFCAKLKNGHNILPECPILLKIICTRSL